MKKLFPFSIAFLLLATYNRSTAQITADSVPTGMYAYNPYVNLSAPSCNTRDSIGFDINCDNIPDFSILLIKGVTMIDGPNFALLYVLNDTIEMCNDTGDFSGFNGRLHYFNAGDPLVCPTTAQWGTDTVYQFGFCGCMACMGPCAASNLFIAFRKSGQLGWMKVSFSLNDAGNCNLAITLSVITVLSPCSGTYVQQIENSSKLSIAPNPFSTQTILRTENIFHNATLSLMNCLGQQVLQMDDLSGQSISLNRDDLPAGLYFVRLAEENKIFTGKLTITEK